MSKNERVPDFVKACREAAINFVTERDPWHGGITAQLIEPGVAHWVSFDLIDIPAYISVSTEWLTEPPSCTRNGLR